MVNVIGIYDFTKNSWRASVNFFDGSSCDGDECGVLAVRLGVFCVAINLSAALSTFFGNFESEAVLASVGFVGYDYDVFALRVQRILSAFASGKNFWMVVR